MDQRVDEMASLLTVRTTFGLGGVRAGHEAMAQGDRESALRAEAAVRRLLARALCLDWTFLAGQAASGLVFPGVTPQEALTISVKKGPKQKEALQQAENLQQQGELAPWVGGLQALQASTKYSIFADLCDPISYFGSGGDLGSIFFDPVVRREMQVAAEAEVEFVQGAESTISVTDRWYLRPVPATLFELRVCLFDGNTISHMATSQAILNELLYKILPNRATPEKMAYLHVASIERSSLLSPPQEETIVTALAVTEELLGAWSAKDQFYVDRAVSAASLPAARRAEIEPAIPEGAAPELAEDWKKMREMFESASGRGVATSQDYLAKLTQIAEAVLNTRLERAGVVSATPGERNYTDQQLWDTIDEVALFLKTAGARMQEIVPDGTGSRLNLLAYVEREIQNRKRLDPLNPAGVGMLQGWVDYLDVVYDVFSRCTLFGLFMGKDADIAPRVQEVLEFFNVPELDPDRVARTPLSEVWAQILGQYEAGTGFAWLANEKGNLVEKRGEVRSVFQDLLKYVGGIQGFLPEYFSSGAFPGKNGLKAHPLDLWRLYLEIEYRLNRYVTQGSRLERRQELAVFSCKNAWEYLASGNVNTFSSWGTRLRAIYDEENDGHTPARMGEDYADFWDALGRCMNEAPEELGDQAWAEVLGYLALFFEKRLKDAKNQKRTETTGAGGTPQ